MTKLWGGLLLAAAVLGGTPRLSAQSQEIQQLLLDVEKLTQFKQILRDMQQGYQVLSSGYTTIRDLSQGNFQLHEVFLDGLLQVSPLVRKYKRVADIISDELSIATEYKSAFAGFKRQGHFTAAELSYLGSVYNNLLEQSTQNLSDLTLILSSGDLRMSDAERLKAIDGIYADTHDKLVFLRSFDAETGMLALQRAREKTEALSLENIYGIKNP